MGLLPGFVQSQGGLSPRRLSCRGGPATGGLGLLAALLIIGIVTVPLARGRLSRLADVRIKAPWSIALALGMQIFALEVVETSAPVQSLVFTHIASYFVGGYFVYRNRHIPALWLVGVGGGMNLL